jgi:hypothetical protein
VRTTKVTLAAVAIAFVACTSKPRDFDTQVELRRLQIIERDAQGAPLSVDIELEYPDCPGEQQEVFQGGKELAQCLAKYKLGDKLPASVHWESTGEGHYDSEVTRIGECTRKRDVADERSYEVVQVCEDVVANGVKVGFHCSRKPTPELLAKCPWFRRS